jgi:hypothetical protein
MAFCGNFMRWLQLINVNGYKLFKASDGLSYKVWVGDKNEKFQKSWWYTITNQQDVAETLAQVREDINKLLNYIQQNPQLWNQHPIAFGIYHTFDLHLSEDEESYIVRYFRCRNFGPTYGQAYRTCLRIEW